MVFVAILLGALIGKFPALSVLVIVYAGTKPRQSESLLCCCTRPGSERKLFAFGRVFG
jgi:hypothetical protein